MIERKPNGFFTTNRFCRWPRPVDAGHGTGLAPHLAILQDETTWQRFERPDSGAWRPGGGRPGLPRREIAALRRHPLWAEHGHKLIYQPVVTREALAGRCRRASRADPRRAAGGRGGPAPGLDESRVMICGSPEMVRDCHKALMERGFGLSRLAAPAQIAVENAW